MRHAVGFVELDHVSNATAGTADLGQRLGCCSTCLPLRSPVVFSVAGRLSPEGSYIPRQGEIHKEVFAIE